MFQFETLLQIVLRVGLLFCVGCSPAAEATRDQTQLYATRVHRGVNVAGAEFGSSVPGVLGRDYIYPAASEIAAYRTMGFNLVRIPVRWERLVGAPGGAFRTEDINGLLEAVRAARAQDMIVIIDLHNYARWSARKEIDSESLIGQGPATVSDLAHFWTQLAGQLGDDPGIWLGIMNEPHGIDVAKWWDIAGAVVTALRSAGVHNRLLVPGSDWTGAHSWVSSGNAHHAARFADPDGNTLFEVHQYLDAGSRGSSGLCEHGSAGRVDAVLAWARQTGARLFVGELAAGPGATCRSEYRNMIAELETSGVVEGWAAWGGGAWFEPNDPFSLPPTAAGEHLEHLEPFLSRNKHDAR